MECTNLTFACFVCNAWVGHLVDSVALILHTPISIYIEQKCNFLSTCVLQSSSQFVNLKENYIDSDQT